MQGLAVKRRSLWTTGSAADILLCRPLEADVEGIHVLKVLEEAHLVTVLDEARGRRRLVGGEQVLRLLAQREVQRDVMFCLCPEVLEAGYVPLGGFRLEVAEGHARQVLHGSRRVHASSKAKNLLFTKQTRTEPPTTNFL